VRRLGWTTDIHLNFVPLSAWDDFVAQINAAQLDGLLITGDISEAEDVGWQLDRLRLAINVPVYYVLGNHDYYQGSIDQVRSQVESISGPQSRMFYLTGHPPIQLGGDWVLCGDDGWADTRVGNYFRSPVRMNDFRMIADLDGLNAVDRRRKLRRLGAECAFRLGKQLHEARNLGRRLLVMTHIPPFRESCWYEGKQSDEDWAPFFVCGAVGWMLRRFCEQHPEQNVLVLCGHTHHSGFVKIAENLQVWTGAADYGNPKIYTILDLDGLHLPKIKWSYRSDR
jgi:3',5'-cyclic-AMP phosphodiesterase